MPDLTPEDRLALLHEAAKAHPELPGILLEMLTQIANGPIPRQQVARPGRAIGAGYAGRAER